jgi:hypothetical protein
MIKTIDTHAAPNGLRDRVVAQITAGIELGQMPSEAAGAAAAVQVATMSPADMLALYRYATAGADEYVTDPTREQVETAVVDFVAAVFLELCTEWAADMLSLECI